jgi:hypothetical protein
MRRIMAAAALAALLGGSVIWGASASASDQLVRGRRCTPGYRPCIPNRPSDCYGGGGNGPRFTAPGVVYRVRGSDRYRLDADNDGRGCEP